MIVEEWGKQQLSGRLWVDPWKFWNDRLSSRAHIKRSGPTMQYEHHRSLPAFIYPYCFWFLQQEPGGKRYFLGDKALLIGAQSLDNREVKRIAQYYMWDYYERTGEHCILTIPLDAVFALKKSVPSGILPTLYVPAGSIPCTKAPQTVCCWPFCRPMSSSVIWMGYPCTALHGKHWKPSWRRSPRAAMFSEGDPYSRRSSSPARIGSPSRTGRTSSASRPWTATSRRA